MVHLNPQSNAAYDVVGRYQQDQVNGFSREQIFKMFEAGGRSVLGNDGGRRPRLSYEPDFSPVARWVSRGPPWGPRPAD